MKEIKAYIKPHKLNDVTRELKKVRKLRGMSVMDVRGFGRRGVNDLSHPVVDDLMDFARYTKIEIFCDDELVGELVALIDRNASTGLRGDGKIYVSDVDIAFKIGKGKLK
ncbi:MAG: P-II family nitrogen regulator [Deltaproteobacteria bacterium]|nr:P-II family nitrogen regulator [Deltaproteobacteria bacterium]MBW2048223.1 P-II family nitrogen regulator [Deltaproteobacteria bacterium]MBW2111146.1 P-II family nitrogen regulator [Deltaproteobacteria bacterium]MBW2354806.1 P-II family nitrogen regulator [Deltaproteobacteria bacterium]HDZ23517.1 P-II family nitrogen regulator [Desulfobacteraceae bacterium]